MNPLIRLSCAALAFLFVGAFVLTADPALGSSRIQNISLKKEGNFTKVTVYADKPFEFSHFTEEAKGGKPYRLIIDCRDAIFDLPQNNFKTGLPAGTIKTIRTSQYQAAPERIVRVVLDMKAPAVYKVAEPETDYEANIAIFTAKDPDFALWVAVLEGEKDQKVSREERGPDLSRTEKAPVPVEEPMSDRTGALLHSPEQSAGQTMAGKEVAETVEKTGVYRRAVSYADTGETVFPAGRKPVLLSRTESDLQDVTKRVVEEPPQTQLTPSPVFWGPQPKKETGTEELSEEKTTTAAKVEGEKAPERTASAIEKGIGKILGPEPVVARETIPAPDTAMVIQGRMEAELSVVPQRRLVQYNPVTDRDVFLPPTEKEEMSFGEAPLPLFENLKLVGILKDKQGNRALLEDGTGFGYILSSGERIRNGYVMAVEDDRATFHVEEYGGYQIMVLVLNPEY
ncbi:MAG: AMIN domain-containing protein [Candidatus Zixiibacteriota bacterium]|nr:MAG: AMIN domain-containing protein [candidate division Zixibacteria bacterium]